MLLIRIQLKCILTFIIMNSSKETGMTTMPDFQLTNVDSKLISDAASSIDGYLREIQSVHKTIESGVMINLTPYWQGPAMEMFEQRINFIIVELATLIKGYTELNEQLMKAGTAYGAADESVKQIIAKLPK